MQPINLGFLNRQIDAESLDARFIFALETIHADDNCVVMGTQRRVATTADEGVPVEHVEALAFAWLARETLAGRPGNLASVTGAAGPRVLGAIYPR